MSADQVERRCFSGTVGTDQCGNFSSVETTVEIIHRSDTTELLGNILKVEDGRHNLIRRRRYALSPILWKLLKIVFTEETLRSPTNEEDHGETVNHLPHISGNRVRHSDETQQFRQGHQYDGTDDRTL